MKTIKVLQAKPGDIIELIDGPTHQQVNSGRFYKVVNTHFSGKITCRPRFNQPLTQLYAHLRCRVVDAVLRRRLCDKTDMGGFVC